MKFLVLFTALLSTASYANFEITPAETSNKDNLIALAQGKLDKSLIWAGGANGTLLKTVDSGASWNPMSIPKGAEKLQFRDVLPVDESTGYAMSVGLKGDSRVYYTADAGSNWQLDYQIEDPDAFFNCVDRDSAGNIWLYGDSLNGQLFIAKKDSNGWQRVAQAPTAQSHEGGFASSGTCLQAQDNNVFIGTGAAAKPRLVNFDGAHWSAIEAPLPAGEQAGIFSLQPYKQGIIVFGGDLKNKQAKNGRVFKYANKEWTALGSIPIAGAIYGSASFIDDKFSTLMAVGPTGAALSNNFGKSWLSLSNNNYWAALCLSATHCIAVGTEGRIDNFIAK